MSDGYRIYRKAIVRAAEIVGSAYQLAVRLEVQPEDVRAWVENSGVPDEVAFMKAVDIILAHDRALPWTQAEVEADLAARRAAG
jgi:hypothetical protein